MLLHQEKNIIFKKKNFFEILICGPKLKQDILILKNSTFFRTIYVCLVILFT